MRFWQENLLAFERKTMKEKYVSKKISPKISFGMEFSIQ